MMTSLPRPAPQRTPLQGRFTRLEPLEARHAIELYAASAGPGNRPRFDYLFEDPPENQSGLDRWIARVSQLQDPMYFAVVDLATGRCEGRQALMRITPEHGCIELGGIYWGPAVARSRISTEACFLHLRHAFDDLGYRRFEWKCNNENTASKRSALRFGFQPEGVFRQHMVVKGKNRDTAWFSIVDSDWPAIKAAFERWLDPANFDAGGRQKERLNATVSNKT